MLPVLVVNLLCASARLTPAKVTEAFTPVPAPANSEWRVAPWYLREPLDPIQF